VLRFLLSGRRWRPRTAWISGPLLKSRQALLALSLSLSLSPSPSHHRGMRGEAKRREEKGVRATGPAKSRFPGAWTLHPGRPCRAVVVAWPLFAPVSLYIHALLRMLVISPLSSRPTTGQISAEIPPNPPSVLSTCDKSPNGTSVNYFKTSMKLTSKRTL
jgi:hypothetical protein